MIPDSTNLSISMKQMKANCKLHRFIILDPIHFYQTVAGPATHPLWHSLRVHQRRTERRAHFQALGAIAAAATPATWANPLSKGLIGAAGGRSRPAGRSRMQGCRRDRKPSETYVARHTPQGIACSFERLRAMRRVAPPLVGQV